MPPGTPEADEVWTGDDVSMRLAQSLELSDFVWALPGVVFVGLIGFFLGFGAQAPTLGWSGVVESGQASMFFLGAAGSVAVALVGIYGPWLTVRFIGRREPIPLRIEDRTLHLGPDRFDPGTIQSAEIRDGSIVLGLSSGESWESIAFAPRDPSRLQQILQRGVCPPD